MVPKRLVSRRLGHLLVVLLWAGRIFRRLGLDKTSHVLGSVAWKRTLGSETLPVLSFSFLLAKKWSVYSTISVTLQYSPKETGSSNWSVSKKIWSPNSPLHLKVIPAVCHSNGSWLRTTHPPPPSSSPPSAQMSTRASQLSSPLLQSLLHSVETPGLWQHPVHSGNVFWMNN